MQSKWRLNYNGYKDDGNVELFKQIVNHNVARDHVRKLLIFFEK